MRRDITWYIAGPMTGYPAFNIPLFDEVAANLRADGYTAVSPAELDDPDTRAAAFASPDGKMGSGVLNGQTWGDFLSRDVKLIADEVGGIVLLPHWYESRGARLEAFVGLLCGHEFAVWGPLSGAMDIAPAQVSWEQRYALRRAEEEV